MKYLKQNLILFLSLMLFSSANAQESNRSWIRIYQVGYSPSGVKVAVLCSKDVGKLRNFELVDAASGKVVLKSRTGKDFGEYGPFKASYRLDFTGFKSPG